MKLISKQEPVKSVAPYVWGAKYLVLDSVPEHKYVEAGETVLVTSVWDGIFKAYSEHNYDYINPQYLQLIDPTPQAEQTSEPVYTLELTESELQGIVVGISSFTYGNRRISAIENGFPQEVVEKAIDVRDEIKELLKENKQ